jgi:pimeloyl-ACP methyl ester carboxylesterase
MFRHPGPAAFVAILFFALVRAAGLAQTPPLPPPKPSSVTTVGTMRVEAYGSGEPAMIFVPGLSCGSWEWVDAVRAYAASHAVYLVTLAGFDGVPAPAGPALDGADDSLLQLITSLKIDRPVLVGHSLGGFLALRFGTEHPDLVRGVVSVDGLPVFPTLMSVTPADRAAAAERIADGIRTATPEAYVASQQQTVAAMVSDPKSVARIAALTAKSDQNATATYASEFFRADLRSDLPKLTVRALEIAPVPTEPAPFEGPQAASASMADRQAGYKAFYSGLLAGAPNLTVTTIPNSKHFVMIDQPSALFDAITVFMGTL